DKLVTGVQTCALPIWNTPVVVPSGGEGDGRGACGGKDVLGLGGAVAGGEHGRADGVECHEADQAVGDGGVGWQGEGDDVVEPVRSEERRVGKEWRWRR